MNQEPFDFEDPIERRLRAMRPAELPRELKEELLDAEPRQIRWLMYAAPLAAAAVWVITLFLMPDRQQQQDGNLTASTDVSTQSRSSDLRVYVPVNEQSTLVNVEDMGVLNAVPTRPVRLMRYTWLDDTTLRQSDGQSTIRRMEPRQQIVPVVMEAY